MLLVNVSTDEYSLFIHKENQEHYFVKNSEIFEKKDQEEIIYNCYHSSIDKEKNSINIVNEIVEIRKEELRGLVVYNAK